MLQMDGSKVILVKQVKMIKNKTASYLNPRTQLEDTGVENPSGFYTLQQRHHNTISTTDTSSMLQVSLADQRSTGFCDYGTQVPESSFYGICTSMVDP